MKKLSLLLVSALLFTTRVINVFADGVVNTGGPGIELPNPLGTESIAELLNRIAGWLFTLSIPLSAIMIIIGAFQIMFAGGNEEKIKTGKHTIVYTVVGFAIILSISGIVLVIKELFGIKK